MHQAITWANIDPDLCRHMMSQVHNELTWEEALNLCIYTGQLSVGQTESDFIIIT